jgi:hypothetical protein
MTAGVLIIWGLLSCCVSAWSLSCQHKQRYEALAEANKKPRSLARLSADRWIDKANYHG